MTARPSLAGSATLNFFGSLVPMIAALVTTPVYLEHIGAARYGVLAIVWMVQGYFGFLDLGLSAATSNRIAQLGEASAAQRESVLWTALVLNAGLGVVGAGVLYALMHVLIGHFDMGPALRAELDPVLPCVAALVPLTNLISVFYGALTGRERFVALNAVQLPITLMYQFLPLGAALLFGPSLRYLVPATMVAGIAAFILSVAVVWRVFPLRLAGGPRREYAGRLLSYGAWKSVSSITQPLLETADRLMIGHALGPQAVAYYQVPFNLAARVRIFPWVISRTLFPRLSSLDAKQAGELSSNAIRGLAAALTPMCVFGIYLMHPFLSLWIGQEFASRANAVGETILAGFWIGSISLVVSCHLEATGRPGVVARCQGYEAVPFFATLWWAMHTFGVLGAALAWSARNVLDAILLFHAARFESRPARMLLAPGLILAVAYLGTFAFAPLSWPGIAMWAVMTAISLAWSARAQPGAFARGLGLVTSVRNVTRRWAQGQ